MFSFFLIQEPKKERRNTDVKAYKTRTIQLSNKHLWTKYVWYEVFHLTYNYVHPKCKTYKTESEIGMRKYKVVYFLCMVWGIFLHFHILSDLKQGIKKFLRHLPTAFIPSLTLLSLISFCQWPKIEISNMANDKWKFNCGTFKATLDDVRYL
jgi:hypothetical protein